jgi:tetratricopeptide (TPR) repeat protein
MGCPSRPLARKPHAAYLKEAKAQQPVRSREAAARLARQAAQSGKSCHELLAEGTQYASKQDWRRAARACREAIALAPDEPVAYAALGGVFLNSKLYTEAAQWYLEAKERSPEGSSEWAVATANAFDLLRQTACDEAAKPEWWTDEELKALSAKVVRAAPADVAANRMRACVLSGWCAAWVAGPRSSAEFKEAGAHFEQAAAGVRLQGLLQRCRPSPRKTRYRPRYPKACSPAHQMSSVPPSQASATASDRWSTSDSPSNSE